MNPTLDRWRGHAARWMRPVLARAAAPFDTPAVPSLRPEDAAHCRAVLAAGSKSFAAAGLLLPPHTRDAAAALYAFCRVSDDAVDLTPDPGPAVVALRARLARIYESAGGAGLADPVDRAFAAVVHARRIPHAVPAALIEGYAWDAEGRRYETIAELRAWCARVAATVGVMVTLLLDRRDPIVLARACDLGVAMQLTNIARDVGEDAAAGRVYLPLAWLRGEGITAESLTAAPRFTPGLGRVVRALLDEADVLYDRADTGLASLPRTVRPAFYAARLVYAAIGDVIRRNGYDSVSQRARTTARAKAALLARALLGVPTLPPLDRSPPLPETAFLTRQPSEQRPVE